MESSDYEYPAPLQRLIGRGVTYFEPWFVLNIDTARAIDVESRYPGKQLMPFAKREDRDDIACFVRADANRVVILHDFATGAWERRRCCTLYDWLRIALEDMIEYDAFEGG